MNDRKNNNQTIKFNLSGLKEEDKINESPNNPVQKLISFNALKLFT